ncbi:acetyl esterase/lipase [Lipingzhangella halophila]|uniref:Acetyl esterase/lipase n=1 Tax=Lipingzhangella halophila TaxID=1783352 RepID=A0A7W7W264_9ACTN|nr:alpha/beta hydrolase [Lipingzhangella halophila]MBB4931426.1 acetyl esterase/lipase [Lipingzhangella halophila]
MAATERFSYGEHPSQVIHVWQPDVAEDAPFPVAVLLHGGWWRDRHDTQSMDRIASELAHSGWLVWNVEYRRIGGDGGGWPQTLDDVRAALALLGERISDGAEPGDPDRVVAIGHSSGGQLALLSVPDSPVTAAVGLAPVTDLRACAERELGENAVTDLLGAAPAKETYDAASPVHNVPFGVPQLIVHGDADSSVPAEQSRTYVAAARTAGDDAEFAEIRGANHTAALDPGHESWRTVRAWMDALG